jgi:hypothetical protein
MKAKRVFYDKAVLPDGEIVEMVIWQLPEASPERPHGLKYSLFYGFDGERIVGYDNELGKGDHKHLGPNEVPYRFVSAEKLVADFLADVERAKNERNA